MPRIRLLGAAVIAALAIGACQGATATPSPSVAASEAPGESASGAASESAGASPSGSGEVLGGASAAPSLNQAVVQIKDVGGSKITGGAYVTEVNPSETAVTIGVIAIGVEDPMPAGIYEGSCATLTTAGSPQIKLTDVQTGASNTVVEASVDSLTSTPHAIAIQDPKSSGKIVACGDIAK